MHARRRQRDRNSYYDERHGYTVYSSSSSYNESNDRQPQQQQQQQQQSQSSTQSQQAPQQTSSSARYSPTRSPNGGTSHGHAHSYNYCNYSQSQNYNQSSSYNNRPYGGRTSHGHHRRRYNYSPELASGTYIAADDPYQHNTCETERDRDYKSTRDKYTDRASLEKKEESERIHNSGDRSADSRKRSSKSSRRTWNPSGVNGDWSEHISSSGKKYYYNCVTEVSQWEKPKEWHDVKRNKYEYSSRTEASCEANARREIRPERESERCEKSERGSHRRAVNAQQSNSYWRNSRPEIEDQRNRPTAIPTIPEDSSVVHNANETRNRHAAPPESNYNRNDYDPRTFGQHSQLPRVISHNASNGSSVTPPPPVVEIQQQQQQQQQQHHHHHQHHHQFTGPPTPTHSENHVDHAVVVEIPVNRKYEFGTYGSLGSTPGPVLTPSLSNYMRDDLVDHVTGWPADVLEFQAQRYFDEATNLGKQLTRVSSELKVARSIVREREIKATLQEQKVMYLRQQITELEESMSQNSLMCDDLCQ